MFNKIYEDEDLVVGIEWEDKLPFLHHHVYNWKLSTHKKMKRVFDSLTKDLRQNGHLELWSYYDKTQSNVDKFCDYYGFSKVAETDTQYIVLKEL
jgi:hypothetical protein